MYPGWEVHLFVVVVTALTVAAAVLMHYEGLRWIAGSLRRFPAIRRRKVLLGVYAVILLHVAEIWLFGAALWLLMQWPAAGHISGATAGFLDTIYLSAITFSTVGFGDLAPVGAVRFLSGTEALTGFILITWSASFLYLEMQQFWKQRN
jgi:hypothetical protein